MVFAIGETPAHFTWMAEIDQIERRLTRILAADVDRYCRLMGNVEEATLRTLHDDREIVAGLIARHRGNLRVAASVRFSTRAVMRVTALASFHP